MFARLAAVLIAAATFTSQASGAPADGLAPAIVGKILAFGGDVGGQPLVVHHLFLPLIKAVGQDPALEQLLAAMSK